MGMDNRAGQGGTDVIKTAMTVSFSSDDLQQFSYLINGTHLGLLSAAAQNIHIQTSHRLLQYVVGIQAAEPDLAASLSEQRQQISRWQAFLPILAHRGSSNLNDLMVQYNLRPDLMICFDETRLQAWLPVTDGFYLLRNGELRRLKPVNLRDLVFDEPYHENHHYYSLQLSQDDYILMLPPDLPQMFAVGEIADLLLGLRQLPAKMSELFQIARQRGYQQEQTWLAMEVLHKEADQRPGPELAGPGARLRSWVDKRRGTPSGQEQHESDSETMEDEAEGPEPLRPSFRQLLADRRWRLRILLPVLLVLALAIVIAAWAGSRQPETGQTDPTGTTEKPTPTLTAAATPTPTVRPTASPTPTEPPVMLVVTARRLNLRDQPNTGGQLLATLENGDQLVQMSEPQDDWVQIQTDDGLVGYVYYPYVGPLDEG